MYEDMCVVCAGICMGAWRGGSNGVSGLAGAESYGGSVKNPIRWDGKDEGIRAVGRGIEGRPVMPICDSTTSSGMLSRQVRTTLALLSIFHAHSEFLSERLSDLLDEASPESASGTTLVLTPRDVMAMELGVLSDLDAKFLEWLAERNEKSGGRKVIVRKGWKDLLGVLLGLG